MSKKTIHVKNEGQKEFQKLVTTLSSSGRKGSWEVWSDFVNMAAISISNAVDRSERAAEREKEYLRIINSYRPDEQELFPQMLAIMVNELERNPDQDFLGDLFMSLGLGNHWKGQFFTPYHICDFMARCSILEPKEMVEEQGYISVNDSCCGAGAMLVAARNWFMHSGVNWTNHVLFVAQDLDRTAALMCYIQLSLLGCAGYVIVGNSLTRPPVGHVLFPHETEGQDYWYLPMFYSDVWHYRRLWYSMDAIFTGKDKEPKESEKPAEQVIELNATKTGQLTLF